MSWDYQRIHLLPGSKLKQKTQNCHSSSDCERAYLAHVWQIAASILVQNFNSHSTVLVFQVQTSSLRSRRGLKSKSTRLLSGTHKAFILLSVTRSLTTSPFLPFLNITSYWAVQGERREENPCGDKEQQENWIVFIRICMSVMPPRASLLLALKLFAYRLGATGQNQLPPDVQQLSF